MATTCTLSGTFTNGDGTPASGSVRFTPSVATANPADDVLLPEGTVSVVLDSYGSFVVNLFRTDDVSWSPSGWTWQVMEIVSGAPRRTYNVELTAASAQLADLAPVVPVDVVTSYVLRTTYDAHVASAGGDLAAEAAARIAADDALGVDIAAAVAGLEADDAAIVAGYEAADTAFAGDLAAEEAARIDADDALGVRIDNVTGTSPIITSSVTVTVGTAGQYPTLTAALAYLSRLMPVVGVNGTINILNDGWTMAEQVIVNDGIDLAWIEIVSDQAEVPIVRSAIVETTSSIPGFTAVGTFRAAFMASNGATLPRIGCDFTMDASGAVTNSPQSGIFLTRGARGFVSEGAGFHDCAGLGAHVIQGATLIASGSEWSGNGTSLDTYYAGGIRCDWQGFVNLVDANIHDNPGQGVMANGASTISLRNALITGNGMDGLQTGGCSIVHARAAQITGNTGRGIYASEGSLIRGLSTVVTGNGGTGIQIDAGARVNGPSWTVSTNGSFGVRCQAFGLFTATTSTIQNNGAVGGVYADGGDVFLSTCTVSGHPAAKDLIVGGGIIRLSGVITTTSGTSSANNVTDSNVAAFNVMTTGVRGAIYGRGGVSANRGSATISAAATSVVVTHGVDFTPAAGEVQVTATSSMGTATKFWVTSLTTSQFTINLDVVPGVSTTFGWSVRRTVA